MRYLSFIPFLLCVYMQTLFAGEEYYSEQAEGYNCHWQNCCQKPIAGFNGFYVGGAGGVSSNLSKMSLFSNAPSGGSGDFQSLAGDLNIYQLKPWAECFAGLGFQCRRIYLGIRGGISFSSFDPRAEKEARFVFDNFFLIRNRLDAELKKREFTFDFKPGFLLSEDSMIFGIVGAAFNTQYLRGLAHFESVEVGIGNIELCKSRCTTGLRLGGGIERLFCQRFSVSMMYVFTQYDRLEQEDTLTISSATVSSLFSTRAFRQVTSLGVSVYF